MIGSPDTSWFDPSVIDPQALPAGLKDSDPMGLEALRKSRDPSVSQPVPGIAHGSIPGLLGIAMNGGTGPASGAPGLAGGMWRPGGNFPTQAPAMPTGAPLPFMGADGSAAAPPMAPQGPPMPPPQAGPAMAPPPGIPTSAAPGADAMASAPQGLPPQTQGNSALPQGSLLDRLFNNIGNFRDANRMTLLAMAGGLAGAPSIGTGIGRAFQAAGPAQMQDRQLGIQNQTAQMLQKQFPNMSPAMALTVATNPAAMQQVLPMMMGISPVQHITLKDALGQEHVVAFDPRTGKMSNPQIEGGGDGGGASGGGAGAMPGGGVGLLAKGVGQYDPTLPADQYLGQFGPEVQAAIKGWLHGDVIPTGNPRSQSIGNASKTFAQTYAAKAGLPFSDATYAAKRQMQVELAKTASPQAIGGQITFGGTSLDHLAKYAGSLANQGNVNTGIAPLSTAINSVRGMGDQTAGLVNQSEGEAQHYGQEISKFYGGGSSGEAERNRFLQAKISYGSGPAQAGVIRAERDQIPGRFIELHGNISKQLDPETAASELARANNPQQRARIDASIAKLDPTGPEAKALRDGRPTPGQLHAAEIFGGQLPSAGAVPQAAAASPSVPAATRFQQLAAGGLSKVDAYAKMHQEGY